mmetsp:Transcript_3730/g.4935  ORF Transcript_3730/g.4935 Transcript_3730/m.4935 type:complete len:97 (+) Transcript_3730:1504-1794(+)
MALRVVKGGEIEFARELVYLIISRERLRVLCNSLSYLGGGHLGCLLTFKTFSIDFFKSGDVMIFLDLVVTSLRQDGQFKHYISSNLKPKQISRIRI